MDLDLYYRSITAELIAVKDRVENAIDARHQGESGSWRESLVRSLIRRHLPATLGVGQGFVVTNEGPTKQLDVIVYDLDFPRIVQEGELVIVTPDAVRAIVEVKSTTGGHQLRSDLQALAHAALICRADAHVRAERTMRRSGLFAGYFAFQRPQTIQASTLTDAFSNSVCLPPELTGTVRRDMHLQQLRSSLRSQPFLGAIDAAALGPDQFVRYWDAQGPNSLIPMSQWKSYDFPDLSFGYFLTNLIAAVVPDSVARNHGLWWPENKKRNGFVIPYPGSEEVLPYLVPGAEEQE